MTDINKPASDGGPAFPHANPLYDGNWDHRATTGGMSLRAWLAGQALAGMLSSGPDEADPRAYAFAARRYADALLAALEADHE